MYCRCCGAYGKDDFFCKKCPACKERYHGSTCSNRCDLIFGDTIVFRAKLGARYHPYNGCHGASIQLTVDDAEACGLIPCNHIPIPGKEAKKFVPSPLPGATEVFRTKSGAKYHLYKGCHGATDSLPIAKAECLALTPCHRVSAEVERLTRPQVKDADASMVNRDGVSREGKYNQLPQCELSLLPRGLLKHHSSYNRDGVPRASAALVRATVPSSGDTSRRVVKVALPANIKETPPVLLVVTISAKNVGSSAAAQGDATADLPSPDGNVVAITVSCVAENCADRMIDGETIVFRSRTGVRYHPYPGCHGATRDLSLAAAVGQALTPCNRFIDPPIGVAITATSVDGDVISYQYYSSYNGDGSPCANATLMRAIMPSNGDTSRRVVKVAPRIIKGTPPVLIVLTISDKTVGSTVAAPDEKLRLICVTNNAAGKETPKV